MTRRRMPARKLYPVIQAAYAECGLACVVMVLRFLGVDVTLHGLSARWNCGLRGLRLGSLVEVLESYSVSTRALRVEIDDLGQLKCPCILHWNFDHFVVLERVSRKALHILDPAIGRRRIPLSEASRLFTGIVLEPDLSNDAPSAPPTGQLQVLAALMPNWRILLKTLPSLLLLTVGLNALMLLLPVFQKVSFERIAPLRDGKLLNNVACLFVVLAVSHSLVQMTRISRLSKLRGALTRGLASNLFGHLIWAKTDFFEARSSARIANQYQAVQAIASTLSEQIISNGVDVLFVLFGIVLLVSVAPLIGGLVAIGVTLYFLIQAALLPELSSRLVSSIQAEAVENAFVFETVESMSAIKIYFAEMARVSMWQNVHEDVSKAQSFYWGFRSIIGVVQDLIVNATWLASTYLGIRLQISGHLSLGMVAATTSWSVFILNRTKSVNEGLLSANLLKTHIARVEDLIRAPKVARTGELNCSGRDHVGKVLEIGLSQVSFRYSDLTPLILRDCSLQVPTGAWIGITGPSGTGKSTLTKLILGLLEPTSGEAFADDLEGVQAVELIRRRAGVVMQGDVLITGSVLDNISFFDIDPDIDLAMRCAKVSCIHDFIEALPMRYNANVGRKGLGLSAGQAQRILLARALYKSRGLLILDEFSSNLDEDVEATILANLRQMEVTLVAIAHRHQVIAACSDVYRLVEGVVIKDPPSTRACLVDRARQRAVAGPFQGYKNS